MATQQAQPSSKKRLHKRGYRIYRIKYGPSGTEHQAFARKISQRGLFIDANRAIYAVGSPLKLNIEIGGAMYTAQGLVRNARTTDARLIRLLKPGMGIEFTDISPELKNLIDAGV